MARAVMLHVRVACTHRLLLESQRYFDRVRLQAGFHAGDIVRNVTSAACPL
jgi:hypothetical protein